MLISDPLSDILALLDARTVVTNRMEIGGDWAFTCQGVRGLKFVALSRGNAWIYSDEIAPLFLQSGDVLLLSGNRPYVLASSLETRPIDISTVIPEAADHLSSSSEITDTYLLGGRVLLEETRAPLLLDVLPAIVHLDATDQNAVLIRWLIERLGHEFKEARAGAALASAQLAQLILLHLLRGHLERGGGDLRGWLSGLSDEHIARALELMHRDAAHDWTLDQLARSVGMSRTAFTLRFRKIMEMAPIAYLTQWRMQLAEREIRDGRKPVGAIGRSVGYASESAFTTAFRRQFGLSPKRYMKERGS
ncbi:AraC family transcriptional regulator [Sphingomonas oleivorans]|uniref:AraC family transcriptional regulator n=1 Tax=Sphingomonas oleivorans TaxID=1735121 RepID=A0A2T5FZ54_9SPHN|nr:AraC family transcriptional regulator [Sphingomonas oleivorans]PTQ11880.1 AraC family transcriptional regulator [Sphingomonas oleivorans]